MPDSDILIDEMAKVKGDSKKRTAEAVIAIIALAYAYRKEGFAFEDYPALNEKVNRILRDLSDNNLADAERRAKKVLEDIEMTGWENESFIWAEREVAGENTLYRYDMQASHLKEVIALWIGIAAVYGYSKYEIRREVLAHGGMPQLSPLWPGDRKLVFKWGKGYQRNIVNGLAVIGQDLVNAVYQYAKVQSFKEQGAIGYRTRRNSSYHCPFCDEMTHRIWPLDAVVLPYHPRCVCIPEPVFEGETE